MTLRISKPGVVKFARVNLCFTHRKTPVLGAKLYQR